MQINGPGDLAVRYDASTSSNPENHAIHTPESPLTTASPMACAGAACVTAAADQPGHAVQNAPFQCLLHFAHLSEVFGRPALRLLPAAGADLSSSSPVSATLSPASASGPILFVHTQRMERACVRNFPGPVGSTAPSGKDAAVAPRSRAGLPAPREVTQRSTARVRSGVTKSPPDDVPSCRTRPSGSSTAPGHVSFGSVRTPTGALPACGEL